MSGKIEALIEASFALVVVVSFIIFIYSRIAKITMREAFDRVINFITGQNKLKDGKQKLIRK
jgi:hypothetical protein